MAKVLTGAEAEKAISEGVVLLDFFAEWCGPCKMIAPLLDNVEKEVGDTAKIIKIDIEQDEELAKKFNVTAVPTIISLNNGEVKETKVGFVPQPHLLKMIQDAQ